jgi:hypothetical protein
MLREGVKRSIVKFALILSLLRRVAQILLSFAHAKSHDVPSLRSSGLTAGKRRIGAIHAVWLSAAKGRLDKSSSTSSM